MNFLSFLEGESPDVLGRTLEEIWGYNDAEIEGVHNFIQFIFPTNQKSASMPGVPILTAQDIETIKQSETAQSNLLISVDWFVKFLKRNDHWITQYNHNHLRISRMVQSVRLLVGDEDAEMTKEITFNLLDGKENKISDKSKSFGRHHSY